MSEHLLKFVVILCGSVITSLPFSYIFHLVGSNLATICCAGMQLISCISMLQLFVTNPAQKYVKKENRFFFFLVLLY
jgi:hypothetical protein